MNKKFELLLDDTIEIFGKKLLRIKAKINFGSVKAGETVGKLRENGKETEKESLFLAKARPEFL